ncbi:MAG: LamG domain-containing protein [Nanoarchaeota archaeon]|nr:LamG domain-containing protein [Nanoarchaeota archaeon]
MNYKIFFFILGIFFISLVVADIISVNSGGSNQTILNPGGNIEGFFSQANRIPIASNLILFSSSGDNNTNDNLSISYSSYDPDGNPITNITDWRLDGSSIAVLNMPFDKNVAEITSGTIRDYSTYGNNGTLGGGTISYAPTWNSSCQVGGCYEFDGVEDYVNIGDKSSLSFTNNIFTISFWVKRETLSNQVGVLKKSGSGWEYAIAEFSTPGSLVFNSWTSGGTNVYSNTVSYSDLTWVNFIWVANGATSIIYKNGVQASSSSKSIYNMSDTSSSFDIGEGGNSGGLKYMNGSIDEVQIFNRALSAEQIQVMYQVGLAGHQVEKMVSEETDKGDIWRVALTPNDRVVDGVTILSNTLTIEDAAPNDPLDVTLVSLNGRNESDTNLNCSAYISDVDDSTLDVNINWFKDNVSQFNQTFPGENNASTFSTLLDSGNLTLGDVWMCSMRTYDGALYSNWIDSNELEIIDITPPNITIISPNSTHNYTTLDVDFNVTLIENENVSMCFYSLDYDSNVTMNEVNDSYFWYEPVLGPGPHFVEFYCNDTSNNWGYNATNFTILNEAGISILFSDNLSDGVRWNVVSLPADDLDALGNNFNGSTYYYMNVSAMNTLVDIYVKADGNLFTSSLDELGLGNETYAVNTTDPTVSNSTVLTMTTNYTLIAGGLGDSSVIYMKFYLDAPSNQPAGIYTNNLFFKAVREGESP